MFVCQLQNWYNAWDAGATQVDIQWPENSDQNEFYIRDNGTGLSQEQFQDRFMRISYNRVNEQGKLVTFPEGVEAGKRVAFGKNGIGRLAAFLFCR
ncbi:MAG: ATP-binding protein [Alphaproteobacteria bacterium]